MYSHRRDYPHYCTGSFTITGRTLIAAGRAGMAMAPSASSGQPSAMIILPSVQPAGTLVHVETSGGGSVLTIRPQKVYLSVVSSSPDLVRGSDYVLYTWGEFNGNRIRRLLFQRGRIPRVRRSRNFRSPGRYDGRFRGKPGARQDAP